MAVPLECLQVHVEGEANGGHVCFFLGGASPVDESMADVEEVDGLMPAGFDVADVELMQ